ncbi:MAG TPA: efflux RND transporter periplasmic adaptor subunit [Stellaceae bacterium]|nr:efflux RND transporter periplasmic adaptor subunit [Stellaceae bacterium]
MNRSAPLPGCLVPLVAALMIAGPAAAASTVLNRQAITRAGIAVTTLHATRVARSIPALGTVLDPAPLIRLQGDIAAADATVAGAKAKVLLEQQQMAQASALYRHGQVISLANYQRAAEDLAANQAALAVARAKRAALLAQTEAGWGPAVTAILRRNGDPLPQLAADKARLVGLSLPPGTTLAEPPQRATAEATGIHFALHLIGPVPGMLGGYPGQSFLYEAAAQPGVPIGTTISASLPAGPQRVGVVVPWSAVLWRDGRALVLRVDAGDRFQPVPIATDVPATGGYFVSASLSPGDRVVVRGAGLLLGAGEEKPQRGGGDEDED